MNYQSIEHDFDSGPIKISQWRLAEDFDKKEELDAEHFRQWFSKQPDAAEFESIFPQIKDVMSPGWRSETEAQKAEAGMEKTFTGGYVSPRNQR